jgi:iron complex outermembrane receptor protein
LNTPRSVYLFPLPNPNSPSGTSLALYSLGGNRNLLPQTATTWSAGADYDANWAPGLSLTATYFNIDYTNLVQSYSNAGTAFTDPRYSGLVTLNPSAAVQSALIASAVGGFNNYSGAAYDPASVAAIVDGTDRNIARLKAYGVDIGGTYKPPISGGDLKLFLNGTYLTLVQQITPNSPSANVAGVAFNPARIRIRGGETWVTGPWSSTVTVNWLGSSTNSYVIPFAKVSSWTTLDAQVAYSPKLSGLLSGVRISLSAQNILNRNPPYLTYDNGTVTGVHFDSTNASPLGRYITLQLRKAW